MTTNICSYGARRLRRSTLSVYIYKTIKLSRTPSVDVYFSSLLHPVTSRVDVAPMGSPLPDT